MQMTPRRLNIAGQVFAGLGIACYAGAYGCAYLGTWSGAQDSLLAGGVAMLPIALGLVFAGRLIARTKPRA